MVLTKLVKLEWDIARPDQAYLAIKAIDDRFLAEGKTDGVWEKNLDVEWGGQWKFVDQAAAEEFVAAIAAVNIEHGRTLISSTITDI
jgi:hypothetical protein